MKTKKTTLLTALAVILFTGNMARATSTNVKVYTTPSHEKLVIESDENGLLRIIDQNGMVVKETPIYKGGNELKISEMTAQKYFLQVKTGETSTVKRLTVK